MKRVFATADPLLAGWLESVLVAAGVGCLLRNRYLGGAIGELPPNECWPEIWVFEDGDLTRAEKIVEAALAPRTDGASPWRCEACGEQLEGQFGQCWRCGGSRPP